MILAEKFHQIALYVPDCEQSAKQMQETMGFDEWSSDTALLVGEVQGRPIETRGRMFFNYQAGPGELELLTYEGPSWHTVHGRTDERGVPTNGPFLSHVSVHVPDLKQAMQDLLAQGYKVEQTFETFDHVNPYLLDRNQHFIEAVFGMRHLYGFDLKLIQRVYG